MNVTHQYITLLFFTAIDLAQNLPSASKDILPMYNNRSAMYERAGKFDEALNDITVVLAVDVKHMKGRARRARILEAQGKLNDAIDELVLLMSLEQIEVSTFITFVLVFFCLFSFF